MNLALDELDLPIRLKTGTPMTDVEFMRFCAANEPTRFERDATGEIIVMSPGFSDGGSTELDVAAELRTWALADARGKAFGPNSGFTVPDSSVRAADASWIPFKRWNSFSEEQRKRSFTPICPEFVIEVRCETDRLKPLEDKMEMWIANGAELAWLLDPTEKTVATYRPGSSPEGSFEPTSVQGTGPVRGFELVMARVWDRSE